MKIYGNEKTSLQLSEKAARMYAECDPLQIIEEDDGSFTMHGIEERAGMSGEEVNSWLEQLADETEGTK